MSRATVGLLILAAFTVACDPDTVPPLAGSNSMGEMASEVSYEAIDLGTLGGAQTLPTALNDHGQVVGRSESGDGRFQAFRWAEGVMRALSGVSGSTSGAEALNDRGLVGGVRMPADVDTRFAIFLWDPAGGARDLEGADNSARVVSINRRGDVLTSVAPEHRDVHGVVWMGGTRRDLGRLNPFSTITHPRAMNDRGQVVGESFAYAAGAAVDFFHPFLWENGQIRDLGVLGQFDCPSQDPERVKCDEGRATDINAQGVVVGSSVTSDLRTRAFIWRAGTMRGLGVLPDRHTWAAGINDRGQVFGHWGSTPGLTEGAWQWELGAGRDLGSLGGGGTRAADMNEQGHIVGSSLTTAGEQHVFLWRRGRIVDLGAGPIEGRSATAVAINVRGDVLGLSGTCLRLFDGTCRLTAPLRGILWRMVRREPTPTPEARID